MNDVKSLSHSDISDIMEGILVEREGSCDSQ